MTLETPFMAFPRHFSDRFSAGLGAFCGWKSLCGTAAPWSLLPERGPGVPMGTMGNGTGMASPGESLVDQLGGDTSDTSDTSEKQPGGFINMGRIWDSDDLFLILMMILMEI